MMDTRSFAGRWLVTLVTSASLLLGCSESDTGNGSDDPADGSSSGADVAFSTDDIEQDSTGHDDTGDVSRSSDVTVTTDLGTRIPDSSSVDAIPPLEDTVTPTDVSSDGTQDTAVDPVDASGPEDGMLADQMASDVEPETEPDATDVADVTDGSSAQEDVSWGDTEEPTDVAMDGATSDLGDTWMEDTADDDSCPVDLQQIFIITNANWLLRFEPETLSVVPLGMVDCPAGGATPFSMAVDQEGYAWVLYSNGSLWKVNTGDVTCQSTNFVSGQQGFTMFGMGFTADGPTTNTETLFISGGSMSMFMFETGYLGSIMLPAGMVSSIAEFPVGPGSPELTGTRLGELWGFFAMSSPSHVSRINKQTAALEKTWPLPNNLQSPEAWAFAHWGGDFYLFFKQQGSVASGAFHLDGLTGVTTEVVPNLGHTITGAGVSICAPAQ